MLQTAFPAEDFSCLSHGNIWSSLMTEELNSPPGAAEVYSDLSFITLQMVVGTVALERQLVTYEDFLPQCTAVANTTQTGAGVGRNQTSSSYDPVSISCAFEAFVRQEVFHRPAEGGVWLPSSGYLPPSEMYPLCAPTMNDTGEFEETRECRDVVVHVCKYIVYVSNAQYLCPFTPALINISISCYLFILLCFRQVKAHTPTDVFRARLLTATVMLWVGSPVTQECSPQPPTWEHFCSTWWPL